MIEISVTGLQKSFDLEKKILDGLTFQINSGERVGLLGKNGAGKTTLFRILTGEIDYDAGEVAIAFGPPRRADLADTGLSRRAIRWRTCCNPPSPGMRRMADEMDAALRADGAGRRIRRATLRRYGELTARFEGLGGYDTDTAVNKVANGLSIPADMRTRLFDTLSGGEKTRVNLGRLILEDTDILLLDEPTNHLDLHATEWLEEYLPRFQGTVVAISPRPLFPGPHRHPRHRDSGRQGGVLQRQLQLLRRGEGTPLSGANEAVREGAGQDRAAREGRAEQAAPVGVHGQRRAAQARVFHGKAHRADAHDGQAHARDRR